MLKYLIRIKGIFKKYGGFTEILASFEESEESLVINKTVLKEIDEKITKILKGRYNHDSYGEKIYVTSDNQYVHLQNTSSGQQESIRILQDIFLIFVEKAKALRIIEEPEAHLFPVAQKHLIELFALMVNQSEENQLIITTHSPYILTVFNNLLFTSRVVEKNPQAEREVNKIIDKQYWLRAKDFSAYSLGNSEDEEAIYCENIVDDKTEMIGQNYLDTVSRILGNDFNQLYKIHAKSFSKRT